MATKFVSALTGPEMDQALTDMAYHNSEAYAVGTRNGVAVGSSDVTYHNNSKYWAEQVYGYTDRAEDAANRAEAAVPSGTAGAVFFDRAQTLTTAQQSQARANIMAGGSNRNLLDNPWFTVNQRQITTQSSPISGYPADRWYGTYSAVTSDGVTLPAQNAVDLYQKLEPDLCAALVGKTVTVSTLEQDGTISTYTLVFPAYGSGEGGNYNMGNGIGCFVQNISGYQRVRFRISDQRTTPFALRAAKLELGSVSTLANDAPPDYGEELAKCQRYFVRIASTATTFPVAFGLKDSSTVVDLLVPTPVEMRARPTTTFSGTHRIWGGGVASRDVASYSTVAKNAIGVYLRATIASGSLPDYYNYVLYMNNGAYIDFSADL